MTQWLQQHAWSLAFASLGLLVVSVVAGIVFVVRMPPDQFTRPKDDRSDSSPRSSTQLAGRVLKNVLGGLLLLGGVILSLPLVPGPGLVLLLVGLSLTDIPGKRSLQMKILRRSWVLGPINWVRSKAGKAPLQVPPH